MARKKKSLMSMEQVVEVAPVMEHVEDVLMSQDVADMSTSGMDACYGEIHPVNESFEGFPKQGDDEPLHIAPVPHGNPECEEQAMDCRPSDNVDGEGNKFDETPVVIAAPPESLGEPDSFFDDAKKKVTSGRRRVSEKALRIRKPRVKTLSVKGIKSEKDDADADSDSDTDSPSADDTDAQDDAYLIVHNHLLDDENDYMDDGEVSTSDEPEDEPSSDTDADVDDDPVEPDNSEEDDVMSYVDDTASDIDDRYDFPSDDDGDDGIEDDGEYGSGDDGDFYDRDIDDDIEREYGDMDEDGDEGLCGGKFPVCDCMPLSNVPFISKSRTVSQFVMPSRGTDPLRFERVSIGRAADKRRVDEAHDKCITDMPYFEFDGHVVGFEACDITDCGCSVQRHSVRVFTSRGIYEFFVVGDIASFLGIHNLNERFNDMLNTVPLFDIRFTPVDELPEYSDVDVEEVTVPCCGILEVGGVFFGMNSQFPLDFGSVLKAISDILNDVSACNRNRRSCSCGCETEKADFFTSYFYVLDV